MRVGVQGVVVIGQVELEVLKGGQDALDELPLVGVFSLVIEESEGGYLYLFWLLKAHYFIL